MEREETRERTVEYRGTGFYVGLVAIILVALILFILAVQNTQEVQVDFLGFEFSVPVFGIAIGAALLAVILDELIGLVWRRRTRTRLEERAELKRLRAAETRSSEERERAEEEPERSAAEGDGPASSAGDEQGERSENRGDYGSS